MVFAQRKVVYQGEKTEERGVVGVLEKMSAAPGVNKGFRCVRGGCGFCAEMPLVGPLKPQTSKPTDNEASTTVIRLNKPIASHLVHETLFHWKIIVKHICRAWGLHRLSVEP